MRFIGKTGELEKLNADVIVRGVFEQAGAGKPQESSLPQVVLNEFDGKLGNSRLFYSADGKQPAQLVLGLGPEHDFDLKAMRKAGTALVEATRSGKFKRVGLDLDCFVTPRNGANVTAQCLTEVAMLGHYTYQKYLTEDKPSHLREVIFVCKDKADTKQAKLGAATGRIIAGGANFARDLQNHPGNYLTPRKLGNIAKSLAGKHKLRCKVMGNTEIAAANMQALLAVAQGSKEPARFIILEHGSPKASGGTYVFVGKGMTFDSGGISIKPGNRMEEMKFDMSGAAAVLGAMQAVAELALPFHVVGLIPSAENMPSAAAVKPGDIIKTSAGTTVEVINTDAEGRLILADALTYAKKYKPNGVINLATLTGACVVALGSHASGLMGNDQDLIEAVKLASERAGEPAWQLPLWDEYYEDIKGDYADIKNSVGRPAGAITAGAFLGTFTKDYAWAHLDIAGTAWTIQNKGYFGKGGTGVGVRLLIQFLRNRAAATGKQR